MEECAPLGPDGHLGFVAPSQPDALTEPNSWSSVLSSSTLPASGLPSNRGVNRTFGILSTFPPTECGIATFSAALAAGIIASGSTVDVVRCGTTPRMEDASVLGTIADRTTPGRFAGAVDVLNRTDVAIVQHEYGLYEGADGASIIEIMDRLVVPTIVVAHTVLSEPTPNQRFVLGRVCHAADVVVVMTETARVRLIAGFGVDPTRVVVIPHGAATPPAGAVPPDDPQARRPRLLTWGLLGPGKGIEWAIDAVADLVDLRPRPRYIIAGATHPKVLAHSGESYRRMLQQRVANSAAASCVTFDDTYRDLASLTDLIRSADLVVLPYDSKDQVTSGVLVDAVAAGRPVVSTAFPHAVELLGGGAGIVVPQRDPAALAAAIRSVLTDRDKASDMAAEARRLAPDLTWTAVAGTYAEVAGQLLEARRSARR